MRLQAPSKLAHLWNRPRKEKVIPSMSRVESLQNLIYLARSHVKAKKSGFAARTATGLHEQFLIDYGTHVDVHGVLGLAEQYTVARAIGYAGLLDSPGKFVSVITEGFNPSWRNLE